MHNLYVNQRALARRDAANVSLDGAGAPAEIWRISVRPSQQAHVELHEVLLQFGRLPAEQREVLILAAVEEMKYEEIAEVLDIPVGTVMSRLSRAREKLRRIVTEPMPLKIVR
jgi:RNA polymerase sigma-70 factor (ECF subfamily)